jgi:hypothetical protein
MKRFKKEKTGVKMLLKKSKTPMYLGFNLSLNGNSLEYKNNPTIKILTI